MMWPVGVLAVLAVVGGWLQFAGALDAGRRLARPGRRAARRGRAARRSVVSSVLAVAARRSAGSRSPGRSTRRRRRCRVPRDAVAQRVLEHKFYFDELYDVRLLPAGRRRSRRASAAASRGRSSRGSLGELGAGVARGSDATSRALQTGLVRTYALAIAAGLAVLAVVFVAVRDERLAHHDPDPPADRGRARRLAAALAAPARPASLALLVALAEVGALDRRARATSTSTAAGLQFDAAAELVQRPRTSPTTSASTASRSGSSGLTVVVMAAAIAYALLGRARAAARLLRADALPDGRDRRRLRRPGPAPLLRLLRGDADPALRADRRLGRAGPAAARRSSSSSTRWPGSLLMLAAIIVFGLSQGTFDLRRLGHERRATGSSSASSPRSRSRRRSSRSTAGCPTPTASRRPRWRRCSRASSRRRPPTASCGSRSPKFPEPAARLPDADPRARGDRPRLRLAARVPRARHPRRDRLLEPRADGPDHARPLRRQRPRARTARVLQMVNHGLISATLFLLAGRDRAADGDGRVRPARRHGPRPAGARDGADDDRRHRARGARLDRVRGRVPDPRRRLPARLGLGRRRRGRDRARGDVHAAADLGGAAPASRARRCPRRRSTCARPSSAILVPLVAACSPSPPGRRRSPTHVFSTVDARRATGRRQLEGT